jgi:hypothetical protein
MPGILWEAITAARLAGPLYSESVAGQGQEIQMAAVCEVGNAWCYDAALYITTSGVDRQTDVASYQAVWLATFPR